MASSGLSSWIVYSRAGCSLCEVMCAELASLLGPERATAVQVVDVGSDPDLERRYGQRIPVLTVDGEFVCAYRLDAERVRAYLLAKGAGDRG